MKRGDKAVALGWIVYAAVVAVFVVKAAAPVPAAKEAGL
jgi:hypothetical protein